MLIVDGVWTVVRVLMIVDGVDGCACQCLIFLQRKHSLDMLDHASVGRARSCIRRTCAIMHPLDVLDHVFLSLLAQLNN